MLIIKNYFNLIAIPKTVECSIYSHDFELDKEGKIVNNPNKTDVYPFGDLIIETPFTKYIFRKVVFAAGYVAEILQYIENHHNDTHIYIDLDTMNPAAGFCMQGKFEVVNKQN